MLLLVAHRLAAASDELSELDRQVGDGDHGTTMARAAGRVRDRLTAPGGAATIDGVLRSTGSVFLDLDGGATGPLFGTFFNGMAGAAAGMTTTDGPGVVAVFQSGLRALRGLSRADVGDKTMMDALIPAIVALEHAVDRSEPPCAALRSAAVAADAGACATQDLLAKFGRGKHLGERVIGHQDPGARSTAIVFGGLADACDQEL